MSKEEDRLRLQSMLERAIRALSGPTIKYHVDFDRRIRLYTARKVISEVLRELKKEDEECLGNRK